MDRNNSDRIQEACEQFKLMMEKLGHKDVVVIYGYTTGTEEVHSGYASDGVINRIGLLTFLLSYEKNKIRHMLIDNNEE